ncbi:MAG: Ldh family oxidoreductase [Acidobacteria bacterium]|nr:Ldh family oxidoreductase [Acidobacteriota bacterium]
MPNFSAPSLEDLAQRILQAMGLAPDDAAWLARLLVKSNLQGHDSHGVARMPQYYQMWRRGGVNPAAKPLIIQEGPVTAVMDGQMGFGQLVARDAMRLCIEKARGGGMAGVGFHNFTHLGRLADFAEMALEHSMLGFLFVGGRSADQWVAPWGGRAGRLSTNPLAFAAPAAECTPISIDYATSAVPEGVVRLKKLRGEKTPPRTLIDADGHPTDDPSVLYASPRGSILPFGGHKGYALSLMVEILACLLGRSGERLAVASVNQSRFGAFAMAIDVSRFAPADEFRKEVDSLIRHVKSSPPAPGFEEVLTPGEPEARQEQKLQAEGIPLEDETWSRIREVAAELSVEIF